MMQLVNFQRHFSKIDELQYEVFTRIREVLEASEPGLENDDNETIDAQRNKLVKKASRLIGEACDELRVIEIKLQDTNQDYGEAGNEYEMTKIEVELYREKIASLKTKLRECQLNSYGMENELIHQQRLTRYVKPVVEKQDKSLGTKEDLFAGRSLEGRQNNAGGNKKTVQDQILTQNKSITNSLQMTRKLMSTSIMQTELNIDLIDQQTRDLSSLNEKLVDLNTVLKKSRQIVKFIEKQDRQDKNRIYLSIGFLLLCSAWVIWRRILKVPVKIMLWTFFKLFGIFNWFAIKQSEADKIEVYATIDNLQITSSPSMMSAITSAIDTDLEYIQEISTGSGDKTWDEMIQETSQRIVDEL